MTDGFAKPTDFWGQYNNMFFVIQQAIAKLNTSTLVRIEKCTNSGGLSPVGFVDVTPLVNQTDSQGKQVPHITIYNVPYFRIQGGANAIIIDPEPGDIGMCCFASRDISKVKSTKKQGNPGSFRQYSMADGLYIGGMLNGAPTQYVQFSTTGIRVHSPVQVKLDAPDIVLDAQTVEINGSTSTTITTPTFTVNGATYLNGSITQLGTGGTGTTAILIGPLNVTNDVTGVGTSLHTHVHSGVQTGTNNTGQPV